MYKYMYMVFLYMYIQSLYRDFLCSAPVYTSTHMARLCLLLVVATAECVPTIRLN